MSENQPEEIQQARHPWVDMAQLIEPMPGPSVVKFSSLKMQMPDGAVQDVAMLTIANNGGVMTAFLSITDLETVIGNAQKLREEMSEARIFLGNPNGGGGSDLSEIARRLMGKG